MTIEFILKLFIKTFFMNMCMSFVLVKITNSRDIDRNNKIKILLINIIMSVLNIILYRILRPYISSTLISVLVYIVGSTINSYIIKPKYTKKGIMIVISLFFTYTSFIFAGIVNFLLKRFTIIKLIDKNIIEFVILGIIQFIFVYFFFKIKRFKDGFSFFKTESSDNNFNNIGILLSIIIVLLCIIYCVYSNYLFGTILVLLIAIIQIYMFYWIRKRITEHYKKQMKDRTVELQAEQLKEKDEIIENLKNELSNVLKINHKYSHRILAAQSSINKLGEKLKFNEEFAKEYSDILDNINQLSSEYKAEISLINKQSVSLPKTNIYSIDNLLEHMKEEALKSNIELNLKINTDINNLIENNISKSKLETLLGDHINDAIIAINSREESNKEILLEIGKNEICIYDTGIEFEIDTLLKLGLDQITTHKLTGGSGIGFMTTFETLKECRASLEIEELKDNKYTKVVKIIFDGLNKYRIKSYRAEEIRKKMTDDRIKIISN